MEQDLRDEAGAGRTQHVIHVLTRDDELAASLILPGLGRVNAAEGSLQALVIAPDRDTVFSLAAAANTKGSRAGTLLTPVTATPRGERLMRQGARAICATADDLLALMGKSLFKPQHLRTVAIVWGEDQLTESLRPTLETVLAEAPRDADRLLFVSQLGEGVEHFATSFLWRARRVQHNAAVAAAGATMEYVACVEDARGHVVRLLLERLDPGVAHLVAFTDRGATDAAQIAVALGALPDDATIRVVRDTSEGAPADLAVFVELPGDLKLLAGAAPGALRTIALVPPSRIVGFAEALGEGATPLSLSNALREAYTTRDQLRDEVLGTLRGRTLSGEVLALEPLLADRDPVLVSAALLRLLETERSKARRAGTVGTPTPARSTVTTSRGAEGARPGDAAWTRLFLSVGERDGLRRGDLVGAITGETGISGQQIGKIELRESHALVEVASDVAEAVVAKMSGITLRGRRVLAKVDVGGSRGGAVERAPRAREGGRGRDAGRPTGPRSGGRERGSGEREYGSKRERGADRSPRQPRAMRESEEWGSRGDRLRNARRRGTDDA